MMKWSPIKEQNSGSDQRGHSSQFTLTLPVLALKSHSRIMESPAGAPSYTFIKGSKEAGYSTGNNSQRSSLRLKVQGSLLSHQPILIQGGYKLGPC